jgi:hypothetical protein
MGLRMSSCELLFYDYEGAAHFVHDRVEIGGQDNLLGIDDHVGRYFRCGPGEAHGFAETALHAIALDRASESATDSEAHAQSRGGSFCGRVLPLPIKYCHGRRKVPAAQLIHAFEVGMAQQAHAAGKSGVTTLRPDTLIRCSGHTGSHSASNIQIAVRSRGDAGEGHFG